MDAKKEFKHYEGVGISSNAIWQAEKGRIIERLAKEAVASCELQHGSPEQRPLISACLGVVLMSPGVLLAQHAIAIFRGEMNLAQLRYEVAMMLMVGLGAWLSIQSVLLRRYFILVTAGDKKVKLVFNRSADLPGLNEFVADAQELFGWQIDDRFHG